MDLPAGIVRLPSLIHYNYWLNFFMVLQKDLVAGEVSNLVPSVLYVCGGDYLFPPVISTVVIIRSCAFRRSSSSSSGGSASKLTCVVFSLGVSGSWGVVLACDLVTAFVTSKALAVAR